MEDFVKNKYGYCYYEIFKDSYALIYNLYIHPEYRNCGKAKLILQHVLNEIKTLGYTGDIKIEVAPKKTIYR